MGEFIHTALTRQHDLPKIRKMISEAAEENKNTIEELQVKEENCYYTEHDKGICITFKDIPSEEFLCTLSLKTDSPLLFLYIYDGDFWGYTLYHNGEEIDDFSTMPDYFIKNGNKTRNSQEHVSLIAKYFDVDEDEIKNYLVAWTDEILQEKESGAYPDDMFTYGNCWQMTDFMEKLGFSFEDFEDEEYYEDENRIEETVEEENKNKQIIEEALTEREIFEKTAGIIPIRAQFPQEKNTEELPNVLDLDYIQSILKPETKAIFGLTEMGKYRQAIAEFTKKIAENPEDSRLYILRAYCYRALRNRLDMDKDLNSALKYDPDNIKILRYRCPVAATTNRYKRHIEDLTRLMELDEEYYNVYLLSRAWRYYWVGDIDAACADIAELIRRGAVWSRDLVYLCETLGIEIPFQLV